MNHAIGIATSWVLVKWFYIDNLSKPNQKRKQVGKRMETLVGASEALLQEIVTEGFFTHLRMISDQSEYKLTKVHMHPHKILGMQYQLN